jgi:predicted DCC family thiol-disulfide oxidoreductase YuxK
MSPAESHIILFDGVCNLCIGIVNFIIKRDSGKRFRFAALQSESGQLLLKEYGISSTDLYSDTNQRFYISSDYKNTIPDIWKEKFLYDSFSRC